MSLRDQILTRAVAPPALVAVVVPEWDATVYMRPFTLAELLELEPIATNEEQLTLKAVVLGVRDETGAAVFTADDAAALKTQGNGHVLQRLAKRALEVGRVTAEATEAAEKN